MWTASTAPKRYELSIEKSNAKKARSIIAMVLARMLLWIVSARTVVSCWVVKGGFGCWLGPETNARGWHPKRSAREKTAGLF